VHLASGKFISNRILAVQFFSIHLAPWFDGFGSEQRILTGTQRVQRTFMSAFQLFSVKPAVPLAAHCRHLKSLVIAFSDNKICFTSD